MHITGEGLQQTPPPRRIPKWVSTYGGGSDLLVEQEGYSEYRRGCLLDRKKEWGRAGADPGISEGGSKIKSMKGVGVGGGVPHPWRGLGHSLSLFF